MTNAPGAHPQAAPPERPPREPSDPSDPAIGQGGIADDPHTRHIDCATCPVRDVACADCVVSVLLGPPQLDGASVAALVVLADRGLVPPLRDPREAGDRQVG